MRGVEAVEHQAGSGMVVADVEVVNDLSVEFAVASGVEVRFNGVACGAVILDDQDERFEAIQVETGEDIEFAALDVDGYEVDVPAPAGNPRSGVAARGMVIVVRASLLGEDDVVDGSDGNLNLDERGAFALATFGVLGVVMEKAEHGDAVGDGERSGAAVFGSGAGGVDDTAVGTCGGGLDAKGVDGFDEEAMPADLFEVEGIAEGDAVVRANFDIIAGGRAAEDVFEDAVFAELGTIKRGGGDGGHGAVGGCVDVFVSAD